MSIKVVPYHPSRRPAKFRGPATPGLKQAVPPDVPMYTSTARPRVECRSGIRPNDGCRREVWSVRRTPGGPDPALSVWVVVRQDEGRPIDATKNRPLVISSPRHPKRCLGHASGARDTLTGFAGWPGPDQQEAPSFCPKRLPRRQSAARPKVRPLNVATFCQNVRCLSVTPALWRGAATSHFSPRVGST